MENELLNLLDEKLSIFFEKNKDYPSKILMSKETYDKVYAELKEEDKATDGWIDLKFKNYKGIKIEIKNDIFIELEK